MLITALRLFSIVLNQSAALFMLFIKPLSLALLFCLLWLTPLSLANASTETLNLRLSLGSSYQSKNDIQTPNTSAGTRFSLYDSAGEGPVSATRLEINWNYKSRHNLRIMLAPLTFEESVVFQQPVAFAGQNFTAGQSLEATYKFNSWRVGYHYRMVDGDKGTLQLGATLKLRDAEIRLQQATTIGVDDDLGLVPLLYVAGKYQITDNLTVGADVDGLAGGPGRAIDLGFTADYQFADRFSVGLDLRVLEGGADVEQVYNFAQFNSASIALVAEF